MSGHWCYAFLRADRATKQRFLVVANFHSHETLRDPRVALPAAAREFLQLPEGTALKFTDRLAVDPVIYESPDTASANIPEVPPLSALYLEIEPNDR